MRKSETYGDKLDRQHRWAGIFWLSVLLLAVYIAVFTKGETYAEQVTRCSNPPYFNFNVCMGWVQGRAN